MFFKLNFVFLNFFYDVQVSPYVFVFFTTCLFFISLFGVVHSLHNIFFILINLEIMMLSISLNFIYFSILLDNIHGFINALLIIGLSAAESVVGLSLLIVFDRVHSCTFITSCSNFRNY